MTSEPMSTFRIKIQLILFPFWVAEKTESELFLTSAHVANVFTSLMGASRLQIIPERLCDLCENLII